MRWPWSRRPASVEEDYRRATGLGWGQSELAAIRDVDLYPQPGQGAVQVFGAAGPGVPTSAKVWREGAWMHVKVRVSDVTVQFRVKHSALDQLPWPEWEPVLPIYEPTGLAVPGTPMPRITIDGLSLDADPYQLEEVDPDA